MHRQCARPHSASLSGRVRICSTQVSSHHNAFTYSALAPHFSSELARRRDVSKDSPIAFLQLTSAPGTLAKYDTTLPVKSASYDNSSAMSWVQQFKSSRVVNVDYGASDATLQSLIASTLEIVPNLTVVAVHYEAKVYTQQEIQARMVTASTKVPVNTSGVRDRAIEAQGAFDYSRRIDDTWERFLMEQAFHKPQVKVLTAVEGRQGIEGAWTDLCEREVPADVGMVVESTSEQTIT